MGLRPGCWGWADSPAGEGSSVRGSGSVSLGSEIPPASRGLGSEVGRGIPGSMKASGLPPNPPGTPTCRQRHALTTPRTSVAQSPHKHTGSGMRQPRTPFTFTLRSRAGPQHPDEGLSPVRATRSFDCTPPLAKAERWYSRKRSPDRRGGLVWENRKETEVGFQKHSPLPAPTPTNGGLPSS